MGLSVNVYKNIKVTYNEDEYNFIAYVIDPDWRYKVKNLEYDKYYVGELVNNSIRYPCSSHGEFRRVLLNIIGRADLVSMEDDIYWDLLEKETDMPFYELINFADNEGCLDFEISKKLYGQFVEYKDKAAKYLEDDEYTRQKYMEWLEVVKDGKDKGVVVFT